MASFAASARWAASRSRRSRALPTTGRDALVRMTARAMKGRSTADWMAALEPARVPCGPINTIDQVFGDPQVVARGLQFALPHAQAGSVPQVGNPIQFSRSRIEYRLAPPVLGEHTEQVLGELLGLTPSEIASLRGRGVV